MANLPLSTLTCQTAM